MDAQESEVGETETGGGRVPFGKSPVTSYPFSLPLLTQVPQFQNAQIQEEISLTVGDAHTRGSAGDKGNL